MLLNQGHDLEEKMIRKMKLGDLIVAGESLDRLLKIELPAPISYKIAKAARPARSEIKTYEREHRKLVEKLGKDNGKGQTVVGFEDIPQFNEELNDLLDIEIEMEIRVVDPRVFDGLETGISAGDLMDTWFLFKD